MNLDPVERAVIGRPKHKHIWTSEPGDTAPYQSIALTTMAFVNLRPLDALSVQRHAVEACGCGDVELVLGPTAKAYV